MEKITLKNLKELVSKQARSSVLYCIEHGERPVLTSIAHFENEIYDLLPPILRELVGEPDNKVKRDLRLMGLVVLFSGVLPNTLGIYDNNKVGPNLNFFACGPFAAGKGELNSVKVWVELINKHLEKIFKQEMVEYRQALKDGVEV